MWPKVQKIAQSGHTDCKPRTASDEGCQSHTNSLNYGGPQLFFVLLLFNVKLFPLKKENIDVGLRQESNLGLEDSRCRQGH